MYDKTIPAAGEIRLQGDVKMLFQPGDRVLVVFGDTPILGTIYSLYSLNKSDVLMWNVKTDLCNNFYPIHKEFLMPAHTETKNYIFDKISK